MTALTYTSLISNTAAYLERGASGSTDPTVYDMLNDLVNRAERRIQGDLKILGSLVPVTAAFTTGLATYAKPDGWRQTVSINYGTGTSSNTRNPIYPRSYEYLRTYWPDQTVTGAPRFYADYDYSHFIVAPTPASNYPFELLYYEIPPLLSTSQQTNWITQYQPHLLQAAVLLECYMFLKDPERAQQWQADYGALLQASNGEDEQRIVDRSVTRKEA